MALEESIEESFESIVYFRIRQISFHEWIRKIAGTQTFTIPLDEDPRGYGDKFFHHRINPSQ